MVQKFTLKARSEMYEDVNGDYVKYEDYATLEQKLKEERQRLNQWRVKYGFPEVEYKYD